MLIAENTSMNEVTFTAEIARHERLSADIEPKYDLRLWRDATDAFGRWYSALGIGTRDVAGSAIEKALFHLLWIARSSGDDWTTRLRLALCLDALGLEDEELRRALDVRDASVLHPLHDVDEPDAVDAIDRAAALVVSAIQANVR